MKNAWKGWFLRIDFWKKFEIKTESDSSSGIFEVPPVRDTPYLEQVLSRKKSLLYNIPIEKILISSFLDGE